MNIVRSFGRIAERPAQVGVAALLGGALTVASLAVGITILARVGGSSTFDLGQADLRSSVGLLAGAELLKLASAAVAVIITRGVQRHILASAPAEGRAASWFGLAGAGLLALAGTLGLAGLMFFNSTATGLPDQATIAQTVSVLGFAALAASGLWAGICGISGLRNGSLPRGLAATGVVLGVTSLVAVLLPTFALFVVLVNLVWSIGLGVVLLRASTPAGREQARHSLL